MKPIQTDQDESDYMSPADAAFATGLSVRQLSRLADAQRVRSIRPGNHRRYHRADIAQLAAGEQQ